MKGCYHKSIKNLIKEKYKNFLVVKARYNKKTKKILPPLEILFLNISIPSKTLENLEDSRNYSKMKKKDN